MARFRKSRNIIPKVIGHALAHIFGQKYDQDSILLSNGIHEIEIDVTGCHPRKRPGRIWVSFDDLHGDLPVCGGNVDKVGVVDTDGGFILHAEIHSTSRRVRWFASIA